MKALKDVEVGGLLTSNARIKSGTRPLPKEALTQETMPLPGFRCVCQDKLGTDVAKKYYEHVSNCPRVLAKDAHASLELLEARK